MENLTASKQVMAERYCLHIRQLKRTISLKAQAIEMLKGRSGITAYRIGEKVTGTRIIDGIEWSTIDLMDRIEKLENEIPTLKAELADITSPLRKLSKTDQELIDREHISYKEFSEPPERPAHKAMSTAEMNAQIEQLLAPYKALERLYDVLPPEWKVPKAI